MQSIISTIKYLADTNVINFLLMAALLGWIIVKMSVKTSFEKGILSVKETIEKSEEDKKNSEIRVKEANETLEKLPQEIEEIQKISNQKADVLKKQIENSTQKTVEYISENVNKIISIEERKSSNELSSKTMELSVEQARNNLIERLKSDNDLQIKFIEESLDEFERIKI